MNDLKVGPLTATDLAAYDVLAESAPGNLMYYSRRYLDFLATEISGGEPLHLGCFADGRLVGALPAFLSPPSALGRVLNSLPFFGSHGGPIVAAGDPCAEKAAKALSAGFFDLGRNLGVAAATIVESPYFPLDDHMPPGLADLRLSHRISQISELPSCEHNTDAIEAALMLAFHQKTRNAIRKGLLSLDTIAEDNGDEALAWLHDQHHAAISALGGAPKSLATLQRLRDVFRPTGDFHIVLGYAGGHRAAGLLLLTHGDTVEYFTPVVPAEYRDKQILSALIFKLMATFAMRGYRRWNWGGTWVSQDGVYRFKSRFGAIDRRYRYYSAVFDHALNVATPKQVLASFPSFFVLPFKAGTE